MSLGLLRRIETVIRERHKDPSLTLSDYFDLIGGTSTGGIIAALLALGRSVTEIENLYFRFAEAVFRPRRRWLGKFGRIFQAQFDERPLARLLKDELGDIALGSDKFRCGLMVVAKRADTASVWPLVNIPTQKFFEYNKHLTLWEILRASTAAPTFFRPHKIADLGMGEQGVFVDGAISMHNSPALQLLMAASLKGFGLNWPVAEDRLLLCSVGTGMVPKLSTVKRLDVDRNYSLLPIVMTQLLFDAAELNTTLLQWMSHSPTARVIDSQIEDLREDQLGGKPLMTYLRYDLALTKDNLEKFGYKLSEAELDQLLDISSIQMIPLYKQIGERAGSQIDPAHFPQNFDLARGQ